jgi:tRNA A37 methylthiotransferase MiaB
MSVDLRRCSLVSLYSMLNDSLFDLVAVSRHVEMVVAISNDVLAAMRRGQRYDGIDSVHSKVESALPKNSIVRKSLRLY